MLREKSIILHSNVIVRSKGEDTLACLDSNCWHFWLSEFSDTTYGMRYFKRTWLVLFTVLARLLFLPPPTSKLSSWWSHSFLVCSCAEQLSWVVSSSREPYMIGSMNQTARAILYIHIWDAEQSYIIEASNRLLRLERAHLCLCSLSEEMASSSYLSAMHGECRTVRKTKCLKHAFQA